MGTELSQVASAADNDAVEPLLRFARSAHEAGGYPANELELRIVELAHVLGLFSIQVYASPTVVILTVGSIPNQQVHVLRVEPRPVDLYAIDRLDEITAALASGRLNRRRTLEEIDELSRHPLRRPVWLVVAAHGLIGAALAPILDGGWRESLGAAAVGLVVGILTRVVLRNRSAELVTPLAAVLASLMACALAVAGFHMATATVTFAALVVLFPGMSLAIGVRELATGHSQAGLANSTYAAVQLVGLVFGVAVGKSLAGTWLGAPPVNTPHPFPQSVNIAAAALVGLGFVVTLRAPARDALWTCTAAVLAIVTNLIATSFLGRIPGVFAAAFVVGFAGNAIARQFHRSSLIFIVPGLLMLVPGSVSYESAASLLAGETLTGIDTAYATLVTMLAIAYGLLASTLLLQNQRATVRERTEGIS